MRRALVLAFALLAATGVARAAPVHDVQVRNNFFAPAVESVDPGDTVRWTLVEGIHTVTSDDEDGTFASGSMSTPGETFEFVTPNEDVRIDYFCSIHGASMSGVIIVGDPDPPTKPVEVRAVPSADWPDLWTALDHLDPDGAYRIELASGTHTVDGREIGRHTLDMGNRNIPLPYTFELTIRGTGATPSDVVIEDGLAFATLEGLRLEHLTVHGGPSGAGILLGGGMRRWFVEDVAIESPGAVGVRVWKGARFGSLRDVAVSGASVAGVSVESCLDCDVVLDGVAVSDSLQGISVRDASSVVIRGSTLSNNGVGIAVRSAAGQRTPARGMFITGNTIAASTSRARAGIPSGSLDLPVGHGIWLHGTLFAEVLANTIDGASIGIALTGPSYGNEIRANSVSATINADLGWDGTGADVCFSGNHAPGRALTSMPPEAETLYACERPATVGVPYPPVLAVTMAWGLGLPGAP